jgi:ribosomal protein S18 acetylase RimI-like enzyme
LAAYEVRPARPEELQAAGAVVGRAYDADGFTDEDYSRVLADAARRARDAEVVVAVDGGTVVGCVTFVLPGTTWAELAHEGEAEFRMLGVHPWMRGPGVGAALVAWCLARARELGCTRVVISSVDSMTAAHRLYRRFGFVRRPELDWQPNPRVHLQGFSLDL